MPRLTHSLINIALDVLWRVRPASTRMPGASTRSESTLTSGNVDDTIALRGLIARFPFWKAGRQLLAERSLATNNIAVAYAEAQALYTLAPKGSRLHATSLSLLGRCFLRRGDSSTALTFLDEAHSLEPTNYLIQEERSAALALQGDKVTALAVLRSIPETQLSAEGRAAMSWLSTPANLS